MAPFLLVRRVMPATVDHAHINSPLLRRVVAAGLVELNQKLERQEKWLPGFVRREFAGFLSCGDPTAGFAWLVCDACEHHRLVPFSCKGRGFCPACGGRRMTESARRWADAVLPRVAVRQCCSTTGGHSPLAAALAARAQVGSGPRGAGRRDRGDPALDRAPRSPAGAAWGTDRQRHGHPAIRGGAESESSLPHPGAGRTVRSRPAHGRTALGSGETTHHRGGRATRGAGGGSRGGVVGAAWVSRGLWAWSRTRTMSRRRYRPQP